MGIFFKNDKKHYCGRYKGIDVWQYGCMIGNNWYGDFYVTLRSILTTIWKNLKRRVQNERKEWKRNKAYPNGTL